MRVNMIFVCAWNMNGNEFETHEKIKSLEQQSSCYSSSQVTSQCYILNDEHTYLRVSVLG